MSITLPLRRPRDSWWPMPITLSVPPSARAMKQHTLDDPTSSAALRPLRDTAMTLLPLAAGMMCHLRFPGIFLPAGPGAYDAAAAAADCGLSRTHRTHSAARRGGTEGDHTR